MTGIYHGEVRPLKCFGGTAEGGMHRSREPAFTTREVRTMNSETGFDQGISFLSLASSSHGEGT